MRGFSNRHTDSPMDRVLLVIWTNVQSSNWIFS